MEQDGRSLRRASGVSLSCIEAGPEDGPLAILLHGFPEDAESWRPQVEALAAAGFRVLAPDQRGYGDSARPDGVAAYGLETLADDVVALAASAGHDRFDLIGHDWGGVVAWWTAARHPLRVRRLAILNAPHPSALGPYARRVPIQLLRSAYMALFQIPALPEKILSAGDYQVLVSTLVRTSRPGVFKQSDLARLKRDWARPGALTAMLNWYRALRLKPPASEGQRIACPTLILWGDKDAFLGRGLAEAGAQLCDDVQIVRFGQAGHWIQHEEPEAVRTALVRFLRSGADPRAPAPAGS